MFKRFWDSKIIDFILLLIQMVLLQINLQKVVGCILQLKDYWFVCRLSFMYLINFRTWLERNLVVLRILSPKKLKHVTIKSWSFEKVNVFEFYSDGLSWAMLLIFSIWVGNVRNNKLIQSFQFFYCLGFLNVDLEILCASQIFLFLYVKYLQNALIFCLHFYTFDSYTSWLKPTELVLVTDGLFAWIKLIYIWLVCTHPYEITRFERVPFALFKICFILLYYKKYLVIGQCFTNALTHFMLLSFYIP